MVGGPSVTVNSTTWSENPVALVARSVALWFVTTAVGVPETTPEAFRLRPAGRLPATTL